MRASKLPGAALYAKYASTPRDPRRYSSDNNEDASSCDEHCATLGARCSRSSTRIEEAYGIPRDRTSARDRRAVVDDGRHHLNIARRSSRIGPVGLVPEVAGALDLRALDASAAVPEQAGSSYAPSTRFPRRGGLASSAFFSSARIRARARARGGPAVIVVNPLYDHVYANVSTRASRRRQSPRSPPCAHRERRTSDLVLMEGHRRFALVARSTMPRRAFVRSRGSRLGSPGVPSSTRGEGDPNASRSRALRLRLLVRV